jgi:hypothetical protein
MAFDPVAHSGHNLGTGFLVGTPFSIGGQGPLYCGITAKHVLKEAYRHQDCARYERGGRAASAPSILFNDLTSIAEEKLRAAWMGRTNADMMRVRHISFIDNLDLAMFIVEPQESAKEVVLQEAPGIPLDAHLPAIGETVHVVSLTGYEFDSPQVRDGEMIRVGSRVSVRWATVLAHEEGAMGHDGTCFRVSCPTVGGMSGGFVCRIGPDGTPVAACGVVSSSPKLPEAEANSFLTRGNTLVAWIPGVLCAELPMVNDSGEPLRLLDMVRSGAIRDISKAPEEFRLHPCEDGSIRLQIGNP